jgi:hypothetical protein
MKFAHKFTMFIFPDPSFHYFYFFFIFSQRIEDLQKQLKSEQKKNKDLSSTLVRLNGIIKTGQDALTQEQKLVKQLQEQMTDKTKVCNSRFYTPVGPDAHLPLTCHLFHIQPSFS